jgi:putative transposase
MRAGLAEHPKDYRWSSYQCRALGMSDRLLDEGPWYEGLGATADKRQDKYRARIEKQHDEGEWNRIRHATQRGRLIGRETFQKQV